MLTPRLESGLKFKGGGGRSSEGRMPPLTRQLASFVVEKPSCQVEERWMTTRGRIHTERLPKRCGAPAVLFFNQ